MNWDEIGRHWRDLSARARAKMRRLTDNGMMNGRPERMLVGRLHARYGEIVDDAGKRILGWSRPPSRNASSKSKSEKGE